LKGEEKKGDERNLTFAKGRRARKRERDTAEYYGKKKRQEKARGGGDLAKVLRRKSLLLPGEEKE